MLFRHSISNLKRVLQSDGCGLVVEAVNRGNEIQRCFLLCGGELLQSGLILDTKVAVGAEGSIRLKTDFHFSGTPTVTTGFNVF